MRIYKWTCTLASHWDVKDQNSEPSYCSTFLPNVIKSTLAPPAEAVEEKQVKSFGLGCLPSRLVSL